MLRLFIGLVGLFFCYILYFLCKYFENNNQISREQWLSTFGFLVGLCIIIMVVPFYTQYTIE